MAKRLIVSTVVLAVVALVILVTVVVWNPGRNRSVEKLVVDENDFVIRDSWPFWNLSSPPDIYAICSNGSAWYDEYIAWANPPRHDNTSVKLSPSLVMEALHTLEQENFLSLNDSYKDASSPSGSLTENLTIESNGKNKTVGFTGNSMLGILPRSSELLGEIEDAISAGRASIANLTLNVTASLSTDHSTLTISGTLVNNENLSFFDNGVFTDPGGGVSLWGVTVVRSDGFTVAESTQGNPNVLFGPFEFLQPNSTRALSNISLNATGFGPGTYAIWGNIGGYLGNTGYSVAASGFTILQLLEVWHPSSGY